MDFTAADRQSPTWNKLKGHYEAQLQTYRTQNDGMLEEPKRNFLLGRIQEVKDLLNLSEPLTETPMAKE